MFFCTPQRAFWLYLLGQLLGALLGGVVSTGTFGAAAAAPNDDMGEEFDRVVTEVNRTKLTDTFEQSCRRTQQPYG